MKYMPKIKFFLSDDYEYYDKINKILKMINDNEVFSVWKSAGPTSFEVVSALKNLQRKYKNWPLWNFRSFC